MTEEERTKSAQPQRNDESDHPSNDSPHETVAVIGLGRFGRFWSELLSRRYSVLGTSRRRIDGLPPRVRQVPIEVAAEARIVFLTVSISSLPTVLEQIAPLLPEDATVVDTCSVKVFPAQEMERILPESVDIIASHPMFGPDSAGERTDRLPMIMWPIRDRYRRYEPLKDVFEQLNMRVEEMSPDDHDREAAFSQGVTHLVGRVLDTMDLRESSIATLGFRRLLQVREQTCNDPLQLFQDLQRFNPYTREMRARFADALAATERLLLDADEKGQ